MRRSSCWTRSTPVSKRVSGNDGYLQTVRRKPWSRLELTELTCQLRGGPGAHLLGPSDTDTARIFGAQLGNNVLHHASATASDVASQEATR